MHKDWLPWPIIGVVPTQNRFFLCMNSMEKNWCNCLTRQYHPHLMTTEWRWYWRCRLSYISARRKLISELNYLVGVETSLSGPRILQVWGESEEQDGVGIHLQPLPQLRVVENLSVKVEFHEVDPAGSESQRILRMTGREILATELSYWFSYCCCFPCLALINSVSTHIPAFHSSLSTSPFSQLVLTNKVDSDDSEKDFKTRESNSV